MGRGDRRGRPGAGGRGRRRARHRGHEQRRARPRRRGGEPPGCEGPPGERPGRPHGDRESVGAAAGDPGPPAARQRPGIVLPVDRPEQPEAVPGEPGYRRRSRPARRGEGRADRRRQGVRRRIARRGAPLLRGDGPVRGRLEGPEPAQAVAVVGRSVDGVGEPRHGPGRSLDRPIQPFQRHSHPRRCPPEARRRPGCTRPGPCRDRRRPGGRLPGRSGRLAGRSGRLSGRGAGHAGAAGGHLEPGQQRLHRRAAHGTGAPARDPACPGRADVEHRPAPVQGQDRPPPGPRSTPQRRRSSRRRRASRA